MHRFLILIMALTAAFAAESRSVADLFWAAPENVFRTLDPSARLDMLDYARFGSDHQTVDRIFGQWRVTTETPQTISMTVDSKAKVQLAMFTQKTDTVIAVVTTVYAPAPNSTVDFYDSHWKPLRKAPFEMPRQESWITRGDDISAVLPFVPVEASFSDDALSLTLSQEAEKLVGKDEYANIKDRLLPPRRYAITGLKFKEVK